MAKTVAMKSVADHLRGQMKKMEMEKSKPKPVSKNPVLVAAGKKGSRGRHLKRLMREL